MGYIVVVADFENREINETDCMWTVQVLRHFLWNNYSSGNQYTAGLAHTGSHVYFLPEGYSVARGIMYYDLAEDSTRRWYFTPTVALTIGSEYKLVVESGKIKALDDVNKVITNGAVYTFTAE